MHSAIKRTHIVLSESDKKKCFNMSNVNSRSLQFSLERVCKVKLQREWRERFFFLYAQRQHNYALCSCRDISCFSVFFFLFHSSRVIKVERDVNKIIMKRSVFKMFSSLMYGKRLAKWLHAKLIARWGGRCVAQKS